MYLINNYNKNIIYSSSLFIILYTLHKNCLVVWLKLINNLTLIISSFKFGDFRFLSNTKSLQFLLIFK